MGTTVEAESVEEVYAALAKAQQAVFEMGVERAYTVVKMDERRDSVSTIGGHPATWYNLPRGSGEHRGRPR